MFTVQDLAVVVLLMLIPLLAPQEGAPQGAAGMQRIAKALGIAAIKVLILCGASSASTPACPCLLLSHLHAWMHSLPTSMPLNWKACTPSLCMMHPSKAHLGTRICSYLDLQAKPGLSPAC